MNHYIVTYIIFCLALLVTFTTCASINRPARMGQQPTAGSYNKTLVIQTIQNYAKYLNEGDCERWTNLFIPTGVKYDEPSPAKGHAELYKFCKQIFVELPKFSYQLMDHVSVTNSAGYRALSHWLIGAVGSDGVPMGQTGYGYYLLNEDYQIVECTGFDYVPQI